jgi:hypothetical protein
MTVDKVYRAWINQPSIHQPLHNMNGKRCIAVYESPGWVRLYFTEDAVHSTLAKTSWITRVKLSSAG